MGRRDEAGLQPRSGAARDFWRQYRATEGRPISWAGQSKEVTDLRAAYDWIAAVPRSCLEQAMRDLDKTFSAFFAGRSSYPTPRKAGLNDSARLQGKEVTVRRLNRKWSEVRLPKIGWVRYRDTRPLSSAVVNATVSRINGRWLVSFACTVEPLVAVPGRPSVGIDRGVATTLALSNGEHITIPNGANVERRRLKAQKVLARRKRGSRRYNKQRAKLAQLAAIAGRVRRHHLHVASTSIARRFDVVGLEDLGIGGMTARAHGAGVRQKAGLNRAILAQGWGIFATMLSYKLEAAGGRLVYVPAAYTSQTCSACGVVDRESRKSQAVFLCVHCGHEAHADTNAALEIRRRSTALLLAEGGHLGPPVEPRTLAA